MENIKIKFIENEPTEVIKRAVEAAKALQEITNNRDKKLILEGKQYLFFEDWQLLSKLDNTTAQVVNTEEIREYGKLVGFHARAAAIKNGEEISAAEAECCFDEPEWYDKPRFQLRSMAQTRACSKALRNCLAFVAVLANYEPTPAEEMQGIKGAIEVTSSKTKKVESKPELPSAHYPQAQGQFHPSNEKPASQKQIDLIFGSTVGGQKKKGIAESHLIHHDEREKIYKLREEGKLTSRKASEIIGWWLGDQKKGIEGERVKREHEGPVEYTD